MAVKLVVDQLPLQHQGAHLDVFIAAVDVYGRGGVALGGPGHQLGQEVGRRRGLLPLVVDEQRRQ